MSSRGSADSVVRYSTVCPTMRRSSRYTLSLTSVRQSFHADASEPAEAPLPSPHHHVWFECVDTIPMISVYIGESGIPVINQKSKKAKRDSNQHQHQAPASVHLDLGGPYIEYLRCLSRLQAGSYPTPQGAENRPINLECRVEQFHNT